MIRPLLKKLNFSKTASMLLVMLFVSKAAGATDIGVATDTYPLKVNDVQVTDANKANVLGDGHFFYDGNTKELVVTTNDNPVVIEFLESGRYTLFLNGQSKLERIKGNGGALTITTYENLPGSVELETNNADGVISGFDDLTIDEKSYVFLLDPKGGKYQGGKLTTAKGEVVKKILIAQYLKPLVDGQTITFPSGKYYIDDLTNMLIDDILYTMVLRADGSHEDDDYYDPVESSIVLNNLNSTNGVMLLIENVEKSILIPGSEEYALQFHGGITLMLPGGTGTISLDVRTEPGFKLMLMIGKSEPKEISANERGIVTFNYAVEKSTYCCLYLVEDDGAKTRATRGQKTAKHSSLYSIKITPQTLCANNPLTFMAEYPQTNVPEVTTTVTETVLPDSDTPMTIDPNTLKKDNGQLAPVVVPLKHLDDYAIDPTLSGHVAAGLLKARVTAKNKYWTLSSGVDVKVPYGVKAYKCSLNNSGTSVILSELDANTTGGIIKANNGVLLSGEARQMYDIVVNPANSVSTISAYDAKSYGTDNLLEPVIDNTHFAADKYYVLQNNVFHAIQDNASEVPAGKAVLKIPAGVSASRSLGIGGDTTGIIEVKSEDVKSEKWYSLDGRMLTMPTKKGVYINNGRKIVVK